MDTLEEIKKLKELLDAGIIDEKDFFEKKAQILGIDLKSKEKKESINEITSEEKTENTLEDLEKKLLLETKIKEKENENIEEKVKEEIIEIDKNKSVKNDTEMEEYYKKEKARLKAEMEIEEEKKNKIKEEKQKNTVKRKEKQKEIISNGKEKVVRILKGTLCILLLLIAIGSFTKSKNGINMVISDIFSGIIFLLLAILASPKITEQVNEIEKLKVYMKYKKYIIWGLVILWITIISIFNK